MMVFMFFASKNVLFVPFKTCLTTALLGCEKSFKIINEIRENMLKVRSILLFDVASPTPKTGKGAKGASVPRHYGHLSCIKQNTFQNISSSIKNRKINPFYIFSLMKTHIDLDSLLNRTILDRWTRMLSRLPLAALAEAGRGFDGAATGQSGFGG